MIVKYVTRADYDEAFPENVPTAARTVYEADAAAPQYTGLLDASGNRLYRIRAPRPIGFMSRLDG